NAAKHGWIQNATKWFDRDEVRSREPRHAADVDSPVQTVPVWAAHQGSTDEAVDRPVAGFTKRFSRKLIQDPKVAIQSTWRYFGVASVAFDRRSRNESSGRLGSRSQPNTRPRKYRRP